jgi:hypothetical protein
MKMRVSAAGCVCVSVLLFVLTTGVRLNGVMASPIPVMKSRKLSAIPTCLSALPGIDDLKICTSSNEMSVRNVDKE